ncbi:hypothetical protein V6N13_149119 [Hibiscus sabdariffa]|uniref:Uncharacterized protein n=1 Tax=Hibiscus sabdariffa TaxID=183260 RepID=A0ABR2EM09_9ROSI
MDKFQGFMLLFLLLISLSKPPVPLATAAARPISSPPDLLGSFATLGVVCKCCDGAGGECSTTWTEPCPQLQCLPWKLH